MLSVVWVVAVTVEEEGIDIEEITMTTDIPYVAKNAVRFDIKDDWLNINKSFL